MTLRPIDAKPARRRPPRKLKLGSTYVVSSGKPPAPLRGPDDRGLFAPKKKYGFVPSEPSLERTPVLDARGKRANTPTAKSYGFLDNPTTPSPTGVLTARGKKARTPPAKVFGFEKPAARAAHGNVLGADGRAMDPREDGTVGYARAPKSAPKRIGEPRVQAQPILGANGRAARGKAPTVGFTDASRQRGGPADVLGPDGKPTARKGKLGF